MALNDVLYLWIFKDKYGEKRVSAVTSSPDAALAARHLDQIDPGAETLVFRRANGPQDIDNAKMAVYAEDPGRVGAELVDPQNPSRAVWGRPADSPSGVLEPIAYPRSAQGLVVPPQRETLGPRRTAASLLTPEGAAVHGIENLAQEVAQAVAGPNAAGPASQPEPGDADAPTQPAASSQLHSRTELGTGHGGSVENPPPAPGSGVPVAGPVPTATAAETEVPASARRTPKRG